MANSLLKRIKRKINKSPEQEVKSKKETPNPPKRIIYYDIIADQLDITYEEAREKYLAFKKEHNVRLHDYVSHRLYRSSKKRTATKLELLERKKEDYINGVMNATGWTREDAVSNMEKARKEHHISYFKYFSYRFFLLNEEETKAKLEGWKRKSEERIEKVMELTGWDRYRTRLHISKVSLVYAIEPDFYLLYKLYKMDDEKIATYARRKDSDRLFAKYNIKSECATLKDKVAFDTEYKDYIKRKFWVNRDTDIDEFMTFIDGLESIFCKPIASGGGQGVEKINLSDWEAEKLFNYLMEKEKLLVEESVVQHDAIDAFRPGCVSTVRVITLQREDGIHIICTGIRFGHKDIVDNFHKDGMCCDVDVKTGEILTDAIDRMGNVYEVHPIGGQKFKGFKLPNWNMVIQLAKDAIQAQPGVNYVGWDIAICQDKAVIIEGNAAPDLVLIQAPYAPVEEGQRYRFQPYF